MSDDLKKVSVDWAEKVLHDICIAKSDPTVSLEGDAKRVYKQLSEWDWFNLVDIDSEHGEEVTRTMLAIEKYKHLKWHKDHPPKKDKPTKWEIVTGKKPRR